MDFVLKALATVTFWFGAVSGFAAGRAYQRFHRANSDQKMARKAAKDIFRQFLRTIPRAIAAGMFLVVTTILLWRVLSSNPEILHPTDPAQIPSPKAS